MTQPHRFGKATPYVANNFLFVPAQWWPESDNLYGAVFIYKKTLDGHWIYLQRIDIPNFSQSCTGFGVSLSVSDTHFVVGVGSGGRYEKGCAFVYNYELETDQWSFLIQLIGSHLSDDAWFGSSVAITENFIAVGAYSNDMPPDDMKSMVRGWRQGDDYGSISFFHILPEGCPEIQNLVGEYAHQGLGMALTMNEQVLVSLARNDNERVAVYEKAPSMNIWSKTFVFPYRGSFSLTETNHLLLSSNTLSSMGAVYIRDSFSEWSLTQEVYYENQRGNCVISRKNGKFIACTILNALPSTLFFFQNDGFGTWKYFENITIDGVVGPPLALRSWYDSYLVATNDVYHNSENGYVFLSSASDSQKSATLNTRCGSIFRGVAQGNFLFDSILGEGVHLNVSLIQGVDFSLETDQDVVYFADGEVVHGKVRIPCNEEFLFITKDFGSISCISEESLAQFRNIY